MIRLLCLYLWIIFCAPAFSQEKSDGLDIDNISLIEAIPLIEAKYKVRFSYIDALLKDTIVSLRIEDTTTLPQIIVELQKQTKLKFTRTGEGFVTISNYTAKDTLSVCGYVVNENSEPLSGIHIFFKATRFNIDTDEKGYFTTTGIPFNTPILVSAPGFRQKVVNSAVFIQDECYTIYLTRMVEELDEVVIQNYLTKGITKSRGNIHIDLKEVEILPGITEPDILQSIQLTPGVNSPYETASGVYIRGGTPSQNLVLWNGIKTYHQGHFFGLLSAFNPYVAKEVNFSKSGISAQYGDRIGGVIDIKTPNHVADRFSGGAGFNMINADAVIHTPIIRDKISLQVSGRRSFTDLLETPTYTQMAKRVFQNTKIAENASLDESRNDFVYEDYNANLIVTPSEYDTVEVNGLYSKNKLDFEGTDTQNSFSDQLLTENEGYNTRWTHKYSNKLSHNIHGYYTRYLLNYEFITKTNGIEEEVESKKNSVEDYGAAIDVTYRLSESNKIQGGYQFSDNSIRYAFVTTTPDYVLIPDQDDRSLITHSAFGEYLIDIPKNIFIKAGLRFNQYVELDKSFLEPRLFIEKHLSSYWRINATGEYRSQSVSKIQESVISDLTLENQVWTLPNNDQFPIITSYQVSMGSTFQKKKWFVDLDTYYKQIDNITSLTAGFINPVDNTYHLGESRIYGMDVFLKKRFRRYKTWISYSYINTRNKFEDLNNDKAFPGNWNIEHTIKWSHFYKINNLQVSIGWLWHTGKSYTNIEGVDDSGELVLLQFGELNASTLPVYHRLDFSAMYDIIPTKKSHLKYRIGFSVLNLYDRNNLLNREFRTTNSLNNNFLNADFYGLGITPNISFRVFW